MSDEEREWRRLARRLARFLNAAWWIDRFAPLLVGTSLAAAVAILLLRNARHELPLGLTLSLAGGALLLPALLAWFLARPRFVGVADALVRIEKHLRLHNALSAALHGATPWPAAPARDRIDAGYHWRWTWLVAPLALSVILIAAATLVPVRDLAAENRPAPQEPPALQDMDSWLDKLSEKEAADPADLARAADQIDQLRDRPPEEWYRHSSMEASDTLKRNLQDSIKRLEKDAATAERSLGALRKHSSQLSDSNRKRLVSEYHESLQGMQSGNLRPGSDLLKSLADLDLNNLESLSPSQAQQLSDALKNTSGACKACLGGMTAPDSWRNDADLLSDGPGAPGQRFPEGGPIKRGPGEAPISLSDKETDLGTRNTEGVASKDFSRATFGDTLAVGDTEHRVDESKPAGRAAGTVRSPGEGGERIWRESLLPSEREVLKRYFK